MGQFRGQGHQAGLGILAQFLHGERPKIETRGEQEPRLAHEDLGKLPGAEIVEALVLLPPKSRDGRGAYLDPTVGFDREVDSQEGVAQVGDGIDVHAQGPGGVVGVEVEALEGQDAVFLGEAEVPGHAVGV